MGLYDLLYKYNMSYDELLKFLRALSGCVYLDYETIERVLDSIYDDYEYKMFVNNKNKGV